MAPPNHERNRLLEQHWREGKTVDEAAMLTGIPRSTVGYYYRKFNRYAKTGIEPPILAPKQQSPTDAFASLLMKAGTLAEFAKTLQNDDPQTAYYRIATFKLLWEVQKYFNFTSEEKKQLVPFMQMWIAAQSKHPTRV